MIQKTILTVALLAIFSIGFAEVPQVINYQGRLTDPAGDPVTDGVYQITFNIWNSESGGALLWSSGSQGVMVTDGLFSYQLGSAVSLPHSLFTDTTRWLAIQVMGDPELLPRTKIISTAYAYQALRADTAGYALSGGGGGGGWVDDGPVVRLDNAADYVGIGTASPEQKLHVTGTIQSTGIKITMGAADGYVLTSDASGDGTWQPPSGGGGGWTDDGFNVRLTDYDNWVGIGTANPYSKLHVYEQDNTVCEIKLANGATGADPADGAVIMMNDVDLSMTNLESGTFSLGTSNSTDMTITSSGEVGIGTSTPSTNLHIYEDDDGDVGLAISNPNTGPGAREKISFRDGLAGIQTYVDGMYNVMEIYSNQGNDRIQLDALSTLLHVGSGVGIDTDDPKANLHINSPYSTSTIMLTNPTTGSASGDGGVLYMVDDAMVMTNREAGNMFLGTNYGIDIAINSSHDVGIGTTTPGYKLDVDGTVSMTGFFMPTGATAGYVLTSNAAGDGTWQPVSGGGGWEDAGAIVRLQTTSDNVSVGATDPGSHKLLVVSSGSGVAGATSYIQNIASDGIGLMVEANSTDLPLLVSQLGSGNILRCDSYTGGWHPVFTIENDGRTIIGSSANPGGLEVYGDGKINDSILTFNNDGIRIGDGATPSASHLVKIERSFNTSSRRYGLFSEVKNSGSGDLIGLYGSVEYTSGSGSYLWGTGGEAKSDQGTRYGLYGQSSVNNTSTATGTSYGAYGAGLYGTNAYGVYGQGAYASTNNYGVYGTCLYSTGNWGGYFYGNLHSTGSNTKGAGGYVIDHPQDPENMYLSHSDVSSPDMMNIYNGNVTLDGNGETVVELPEYFEALNNDFRYQLTAIGAPAPDLYIAEKISNNRFVIAGGKPFMEVSWQVTGTRRDPFADAAKKPTEEIKSDSEKGLYMHPELYGYGMEKSINNENHSNISDEEGNME